MAEGFDLVVIGTGVAGTTIARQCRSAGWRVAVVDERPYGGTCALRGCDPKRAMLGVAEAVDQVDRLIGQGIAGEATLDWPALQAFKRRFTDPVPETRERQLRDAGITCLHGHARVVDLDRVAVDGEALSATHIALATGARPVPLGIDGEHLLLTSDDFLELPELPAHVVLVGGGFIGFEFAHLAARAGAHVTLLHRDDRPLAPFDPDLVHGLIQYSRGLGINIRLEAEVVAITEAGGGVCVRTADGDTILADIAVHTAGRAPAPVDAEPAARIERDHAGRPLLTPYLQSISNPAVYAAGDADASGPPLTPVATYEGGIVASNLLNGPGRSVDYRGVPSVVFTVPPLAAVGLTEEAARDQSLRFRSYGHPTDRWYSARRRNQPASFKLLVEEDSDRLLGAHLFGPDAAELINLFALAIHAGLPAGELRETLFAYPTAASEIGAMLPESLRAPAPPDHNVVHRH